MQLKRNRLRLFSYLIIAYMLIAFGWWTVLLHKKNKEVFQTKVESLRLEMMQENTYRNEQQFKNSGTYLDLEKKYNTQEGMILGEAAVIMLSLGIGLWMINRGYADLIASERSKKNFLLSVSHELKSPIASIRLALQTIKERTLTRDQLRDTAVQGIEESERLHKLVNNILLATRMETGYNTNPERLKIARLARESAEIVKRQYPDAVIEIEVGDPELEIVMDRLSLESILINLLENALKYSFDKQSARLEIYEDEKLHFRFIDQGQGIPESERQNIFRKFYRIGAENTRRTKGTGLGLYIVDHLVKINGGSIRIRENVPKGTIFELEFPHKEL